jgi:hypothetical protein
MGAAVRAATERSGIGEPMKLSRIRSVVPPGVRTQRHALSSPTGRAPRDSGPTETECPERPFEPAVSIGENVEAAAAGLAGREPDVEAMAATEQLRRLAPRIPVSVPPASWQACRQGGEGVRDTLDDRVLDGDRHGGNHGSNRRAQKLRGGAGRRHRRSCGRAARRRRRRIKCRTIRPRKGEAGPAGSATARFQTIPKASTRQERGGYFVRSISPSPEAECASVARQ